MKYPLEGLKGVKHIPERFESWNGQTGDRGCFIGFEEASQDGKWTQDGDGSVVVVMVTPKSGDCIDEVVIPETEGGFPVAGVEHTCSEEESIRMLRLPDSIAWIGADALRFVERVELYPTENPCCKVHGDFLLSADGKTLLKVLKGQEDYLFVPRGVEAVAAGAFAYTQAEHIYLPGTVRSIGEEAFAFSKVRAISIPEGVTEIPRGAFRGSLVAAVILPDGLLRIGKDAFRDACLMEMTLPDSVVSIGEDAFAENADLFRVKLPAGLERIADGTFRDCPMLTHIELPAGISSIGDFAFKGTGMDKLSIPQRVKKIGSAAFMECRLLREVNLPDRLEVLGEYAFEDCRPSRIRVPDEIAEIGEWALPVNAEHICVENGAIYTADRTVLLRCSYDAESLVVPDTVQRMSDFACEGCSRLRWVVLPDELTSLGDFCFKGCAAMERISLPGSLTSLPRGTFLDCSSLEEVVLPEMLRELNWRVFRNCTALRVVDAPMRGAVGGRFTNLKPLAGPETPVIRVVEGSPLHCSLIDFNREHPNQAVKIALLP